MFHRLRACVVAAALSALALLSGCAQTVPGVASPVGGDSSTGPTAAGTTPSAGAAAGQVVDYPEIAVGECFTDDFTGTTEVVRPGSKYVTRIDCARPHDAEATAAFALDTAEGDFDAKSQAAKERCAKEAGTYVGSAAAGKVLNAGYVIPTKAAYDDGRTAVLCVVRPKAGTLTGSVRAR